MPEYHESVHDVVVRMEVLNFQIGQQQDAHWFLCQFCCWSIEITTTKVQMVRTSYLEKHDMCDRASRKKLTIRNRLRCYFVFFIFRFFFVWALLCIYVFSIEENVFNEIGFSVIFTSCCLLLLLFHKMLHVHFL